MDLTFTRRTKPARPVRMDQAHRDRVAPPVTLASPPPGWQLMGRFTTTTTRRVGTKVQRVTQHHAARLATPSLERATIQSSPIRDPDGNLVAVKETVLRIRMPQAIKALTLPQQAAVLDYAATVEAVVASGGTSDPTGGGGGAAGSRGPSLAKLAAVERLRKYHAVMAGDLVVHLAGNGRDDPSHKFQTRSAPVRQIMDWLAVDHKSRGAMLDAMGIPRGNDPARNRLALVIATTAQKMAVAAGLAE